MKTGHKELFVWQKSMDFAVFVYKLIKKLPDCEKFGLISQMQRAVSSIAANIAEGYARKSQKDFMRFLYIALGSSAELETFLELAYRLEYISNQELDESNQFNDEIRRMLKSLIKSIAERQ